MVSRKGITPEMTFTCCDCGQKVTGREILDDTNRLYIVNKDKGWFRCECCQEDAEERN
jgi:hypothetical protein